MKFIYILHYCDYAVVYADCNKYDTYNGVEPSLDILHFTIKVAEPLNAESKYPGHNQHRQSSSYGK